MNLAPLVFPYLFIFLLKLGLLYHLQCQRSALVLSRHPWSPSQPDCWNHRDESGMVLLKARTSHPPGDTHELWSAVSRRGPRMLCML